MSSYPPPTYVVPIYNSAYYASETATGLTTAEASGIFLKKTSPDTATALETFTGGIALTNIQSTTATGDLLIYPAVTDGEIYIGVDKTATTGRTAHIHIGDGNSMPAGAGIHLNNGTSNSSNTNIMNGANTAGICNIMTGATSTGTVNIATGTGTSVTQTTKVNIGSVATSGAIAIGNTNNVTTITNPRLTYSYGSTIPSYDTNQLGKIYSSYISTASATAIVNNTLTGNVLRISSLPLGIYYCAYSVCVTSNSTTAAANITKFQTYINTTSVATGDPYSYGMASLALPTGTTVGVTTVLENAMCLNGSAIIKTTGVGDLSLYYFIAGSSMQFYFNNSRPYSYLTATRIA